MYTSYHSKYFAYELTRRCSADSAEKLTGVIASAQVDLNPHQVDAALFAFRSPLSRGALLADEVGLGKTIEAGLVVSQRWAERRRRILVITPANLRKQWHQELSDKFFLPCVILETRSYNEAIRQGRLRPFDLKDQIIICSYQFARAKASDVSCMPWDLVVIDEAHRLRNVYELPGTFDLVLSNPPFHASPHELERIFRSARNKLEKGCEMYIVVENKYLEKLRAVMSDVFGNAQEHFHSEDNYTILKARK